MICKSSAKETTKLNDNIITDIVAIYIIDGFETVNIQYEQKALVS